jgi:hypothetical protein
MIFSSRSLRGIAVLDLFRAMLKEEWRLHSTLFGSINFALFPVFIVIISCASTLLLPLVSEELPEGTVLSVTVALFVVMGMMIGGFGLMGKEVMNRRLGHVSLLSFSARTLPFTERFIFINFVMKDIVYYFVFWILPFGAGFMVGAPFIGVSLSTALLLLLSVMLSFLTGLAVIFLLSVIYIRSRWVLFGVIITGIVVLATAWAVTGISPLLFFPPLVLFISFSPLVLTISLMVIIIPFIFAAAFLATDYHDTERYYPDRFTTLTTYLRRLPYPALITKDFLDLQRSGSGVGQTLFSFLLPLGIIWFFLSLLPSLFWEGERIISFALVMGIFSATMFTWITEFDSISSYGCLPIGIGQLITSKAVTYALLQFIPASLLVIVALATANGGFLPYAILVWLSLSLYCLAVTIYLMGLQPAAMLYNARVFIVYLILTGFPALALAGVAIINELFLLGSVLLLIPAWVLVLKARTKWGMRDFTGF